MITKWEWVDEAQKEKKEEFHLPGRVIQKDLTEVTLKRTKKQGLGEGFNSKQEYACLNDAVGIHFGAMGSASPETVNSPSKLTFVHSLKKLYFVVFLGILATACVRNDGPLALKMLIISGTPPKDRE
ncbi:hypothetical protein VNO77_02639 [Canavalia gladiata]|uniref:Uncharacterized protein n=1 Tax=Canavalia gladiata TaxID=3824 RepID=A0AAN9MU47_CANGL